MVLKPYGKTLSLLVMFVVLGTAGGQAAAATFENLDDVTLLSGSPLHVPLDGLDAGGLPLTYSAEAAHVSGDATVSTFIPEGNRSM